MLKTKTGHYFVTPDNGTLTFVAERLGVAELRQIDEAANRLRKSKESYTFHGRDVYACTGAKLAAGTISFQQVGTRLKPDIVSIDYQKPKFDGSALLGMIPVLDAQFGNVWTNIDQKTFHRLGARKGDALLVKISKDRKAVFEGRVRFVNCFGDVPAGQPLAYLNSLLNLSFALNRDSFARAHNIGSGPKWRVRVERAE